MSPIHVCLYREAMHLHYFTLTHYMSGCSHAHIYTGQPLPNLLKTVL